MRNLATVQKVVSLSPIVGADQIECATVLGWKCVVKKGEFKENDLGVYVEIDSILPVDNPYFDFMKDRKYRVKTIKLRGQISQGLLMPLTILGSKIRVYEGLDVTDLLHIKKYEPPEEYSFTPPKKKSLWWNLVYTLPFLKMFRKKVGFGSSFPTHLVPKTDETRLQAFSTDFLDKYKGIPISITEKMDGTSVTFIWNKGRFSVASRNVWFPNKSTNKYWQMAISLNLSQILAVLSRRTDIALQGEICGPGIQGNKYNLSKNTFFLYGAYNIKERRYMTPEELLRLYSCLLKEEHFSLFKIVPTIYTDINTLCLGTVEEWVQKATMKSTVNPDTWAEGIVIRSLDNKPYGVEKMNGKRFSFKVINPEFLLKWGE